MPLNILIDRTTLGAGNRLLLKAENITIQHVRKPFLIPIPATDARTMDLGYRSVNITVTGVASETGTNGVEGGINIADRDDLELVAGSWGEEGEIVQISDLEVSPARVYDVKIQSISLSRESPQILWKFTIQTIGVQTFPVGIPAGS